MSDDVEVDMSTEEGLKAWRAEADAILAQAIANGATAQQIGQGFLDEIEKLARDHRDLIAKIVAGEAKLMAQIDRVVAERESLKFENEELTAENETLTRNADAWHATREELQRAHAEAAGLHLRRAQAAEAEVQRLTAELAAARGAK